MEVMKGFEDRPLKVSVPWFYYLNVQANDMPVISMLDTKTGLLVIKFRTTQASSSNS